MLGGAPNDASLTATSQLKKPIRQLPTTNSVEEEGKEDVQGVEDVYSTQICKFAGQCVA